MKRVLQTIIILIFLSSCTYEEFSPEEWAVEPFLHIEKSGIVMPNIVSEVVVDIATNFKNISVISSAAWCKVYENDKRIYINLERNNSAEQREAIITVTISRGNKSMQKDIFLVQTGGYWDLVGDLSVFWSPEVSESQKKIISNMINNMVYVRGGKFVMGKDKESHNVTLSDFYISKYELTQAEWNALMVTNNSQYKGSNLPVTDMTVEDIQIYLRNLYIACGREFGLPTEAQWEYAARGGEFSMGYLYSGGNEYDKVGHFANSLSTENSPSHTTVPVGQFISNELGLYDMSGNVSELCYDLYAEYDLQDQVDPIGPSWTEKKYHVERGGSFEEFWSTVYDRSIWYDSKSNGVRLILKR